MIPQNPSPSKAPQAYRPSHPRIEQQSRTIPRSSHLPNRRRRRPQGPWRSVESHETRTVRLPLSERHQTLNHLVTSTSPPTVTPNNNPFANHQFIDNNLYYEPVAPPTTSFVPHFVSFEEHEHLRAESERKRADREKQVNDIYLSIILAQQGSTNPHSNTEHKAERDLGRPQKQRKRSEAQKHKSRLRLAKKLGLVIELPQEEKIVAVSNEIVVDSAVESVETVVSELDSTEDSFDALLKEFD